MRHRERRTALGQQVEVEPHAGRLTRSQTAQPVTDLGFSLDPPLLAHYRIVARLLCDGGASDRGATASEIRREFLPLLGTAGLLTACGSDTDTPAPAGATRTVTHEAGTAS